MPGPNFKMGGGNFKVPDNVADPLFPALTGVSSDPQTAGVTGAQRNSGPGVHGECDGEGPGLSAFSRGGDGIVGRGANHGIFGESRSALHSGVRGDNNSGGAGVSGISDAAEGVGTYGRGGRVGVYGAPPGDDGRHPEAKGGLAGFFAGDIMVTGHIHCFDCKLTGADFAEHFDSLDQTIAEPGTVVVINKEGKLEPSKQAYDRKVAGVISGAGDYKPGVLLDSRNPSMNSVALALVGKVYCKVDATFLPIEVGDLLTSAPTLGHAMKAADSQRAFGAVVGKALEALPKGKGLIPILVCLQ